MHQLSLLFSLHLRLPAGVLSHHEKLRSIRNELPHTIKQAAHRYLDFEPVYGFTHDGTDGLLPLIWASDNNGEQTGFRLLQALREIQLFCLLVYSR